MEHTLLPFNLVSQPSADSIGFCFFNGIISTLFLKDMFARYRILGWQSFFSQKCADLVYRLLVFSVENKKPAESSQLLLLNVISLFSLDPLRGFSLSCIVHFSVMWLCVFKNLFFLRVFELLKSLTIFHWSWRTHSYLFR